MAPNKAWMDLVDDRLSAECLDGLASEKDLYPDRHSVWPMVPPLPPMAAAAATTAAIGPLRLLSETLRLPRPHRPTVTSPISFQRLTALSAASPPPSTVSSSSGGSVDPAQLPPALRDIVGLFQSVPDARTRYKQLLAYASRLPPMDPALKTEANRVRGCVSQVWVHAEPVEGGALVRFHADSDAQLTKGLAALLVLGLSGAPPGDVARVPVEFIDLLGIRQSLSPSRNSRLLNMLSLMKRKALEIADSGGDAGAGAGAGAGASQRSVPVIAEPSGVDKNEPEFAAFGAQEEAKSEMVETRDEEQQSEEEEVPAVAVKENGASSLWGGRKDRIRESLERALSPVELEIVDISHLHKGHAAMARSSNGETRFNVRVVSKEFEGKSLLKKHRAVYDLLQDELKTGLHALSIDAKTPSEV